MDPAEAARALIRTEVEFDRKVDGRYFYRLRHADDIEAKSIYRRRAGNGEGVALSVGRDAKNAEHVLQVLFDEDLWNATTAHDYLVQHYSVEYSRRLEQVKYTYFPRLGAEAIVSTQPSPSMYSKRPSRSLFRYASK